jgi:glucose-6-phosphate dehydrogenase assembly protein OpcA
MNAFILAAQVGAQSEHRVLDTTVSVANIVALLAVMASVVGLLNSNLKDRRERKKQYADEIRKSAALLTVKLERWRDLTASLFEEVQPEITNANIRIEKGKNVIATRDLFWKAVGMVLLSISKRISDEEIELGDASLYGYDAKVRALFLSALSRLKVLRTAIYESTLMRTQTEILRMMDGTLQSATLDNKLRGIVRQLERHFQDQATLIIRPFEKEMIRLLDATDDEIGRKSVPLSSADNIFPSVQDILDAVHQMS